MRAAECDYFFMGVKAVYRLIIVMLLALLVFAAGVSYVGWRNMREENTELELTLSRLDEQKKFLSDEKEYKEEYFRRLVYDEDFASRVIREKLGVVEPDEIIFRFEDDNPLASDAPSKSHPLQSSADAEQTQSDRAERDGAAYLRSTLLERIFESVKNRKPDPSSVSRQNGGRAEQGGGNSASTIVLRDSPSAEKSADSASAAQSETPPSESGEGGIKIPKGPKPIIFRNI